MKTRRGRAVTLLGLLGAPAFALAQEAVTDSTTMDFNRIHWPGVMFDLAVLTMIYMALFKIFSRWPSQERWLVGASLLLLPPTATYVLWQVLSPVHLSTWHPVRDTAIYWSAIAALLAVLWWLLKTRTQWLGQPQPLPRRPLAMNEHSVKMNVQAEHSEPEATPTAGQSSARAPTPGIGPELSASPKTPAASPTSAAPAPVAAPVAAQHVGTSAAECVFISYRREDSADITGRIYDRLVPNFGRERVFKDVDSIPLGVDFREHLGAVVSRCDVVLAIIGPKWLQVTGAKGRRLDDTGDFVRIELEAALSRGIPVIPVLVGGAGVPAESELPAPLAAIAYRNGLPVRPDPDFHRDMDRLIAGLARYERP